MGLWAVVDDQVVVSEMIPLRLYAYAAIALAVIGSLWYVRHLQNSNTKLKQDLSQIEANYAALQAAQAHERKIATEATNEFQRTVKALEAARADIPVRRVRLCTNTPVSAPTGTASGTDSPNRTQLPEASGFNPGYGSGVQTGVVDRWSDAGPDVGPELYSLADEADLAVARCNALIKWVGSR